MSSNMHLTGLQEQSNDVQEAYLNEREEIQNAKTKFNIITAIMVVWATIVTLAIIIMVVVVFTFMRNRPELSAIPSAESYTSDAETGHTKSYLGDDDDEEEEEVPQNITSAVNLNFGQRKVASGEGREIDVPGEENADVRQQVSSQQHEFEVEKVSALFEEDDGDEAPAAAAAAESISGGIQARPNFRNAVTTSRAGTGQFRALFFPDSGSSTF